jgi:phosphate starvation-inducible PhoH-like protein
VRKRNRHNGSEEFLPESKYHSPAPSVKKFTIKYLNQKQREYGRIIQQNTIILSIGAAGSGKTYLAALHAMDDFLAGRVEKIVVCRPAVNAGGEDIGFLPGTLQEKMDPYIRPIFDAFALQWNPKQIQTMVDYGKIEIVPLAFMRGRTLRDAFIICDEAQNATDDQLLMLLSRLGENSKMIITGDPSQRDIVGRPFQKARQRLSNVRGIAFVDFCDDDVVRHPLVQQILRRWRPVDVPTVAAYDDVEEELGALPDFLTTPIPVYMNGHSAGDD